MEQIKWVVRKYTAYIVAPETTYSAVEEDNYSYEPLSNTISPAWAEHQFYEATAQKSYFAALKKARELNGK